MNDFKQQAQHITPKTNKKRPYGEAVESSLDVKAFATLEEAETGLFMIKARKYYRNSIKVDDITYSQMKAIFDILGIDTEEVIK